jgi:hypothetical protein
MDRNIKTTDLNETGCESVDWVHLPRVLHGCMHNNKPSGFIESRELENPGDHSPFSKDSATRIQLYQKLPVTYSH